MADITAIILTMNEMKNIKDCVESILGFVKRIIVVDSGSIDSTREIAESYGAETYFHDFENYAAQFNWALDTIPINTNWILRIDADERFTLPLKEEVEKAIEEYSNSDVNGFILKFKVFFLGRWIKYGGVYPIRRLSIFKTGYGYIENRKMDEHSILKSGIAIELKNDVLHYDFKNLTYWTSKQNWYATREMQDHLLANNTKTINSFKNTAIQARRKQKIIYYKLPLFLRPLLLFVYRYIFQLGFLDGKEGLIFHFLQTFWYRFLVDAKIFEHKVLGYSIEETGALRANE